MRAAFEGAAADRGLSNIHLIAAGWPEAEVEVHDVAFVADVLYFVPDAVPFIEKLDRSARRACFIMHRVEELAVALGELPDLVGARRPPEPGAIELYNLLAAMGIHANVRIVRIPAGATFESQEEAMAEVRLRLGLGPDDHAHDGRIRAALGDLLTASDGGLRLARRTQSAIIWWEKGA
jgi:hypothetical protein